MSIQKVRRPPVRSGDIVKIPLTRGMVAVVDAEDYEVGNANWSAVFGKSKCYAANNSGGRGFIRLHVVIAERMGLNTAGKEIDHKDGDGLNCRRSNLRSATRMQNAYNRGRLPRNTSGHKGVSWSTAANKWLVQIRYGGRCHHLGVYKDLELAAFVYAEAAHKHHGEFARVL